MSSLGSDSVTHLIRRAKDEHRAGRFSAAEALYRRVAASAPAAAAEAHRCLGILYAQSGRTEDAVEEFSAAVARGSQSAELHMALADALARLGRAAESAASYRNVLALAPRALKAWINLGAMQQLLDDPASAADSFARALTLDPASFEAHFNLGLALSAQRRFAEAAAAYRGALQANPNAAAAQLGLGRALEGQLLHDQALPCFERAVVLDPARAEAHNELGLALSARGRLDDAVAAYRKALALDPLAAPVHANLAAVLSEQGRLDEAIVANREALRIDPGMVQVRINLGLALEGVRRFEEAASAYRDAIARDPRSAPARFNLGNALHHMGDLTEAAAEYERALALDPEHAPAHNNLGTVLFERGEMAAAEQCFRRALTLRPDYAEAVNNIGIVYHSRGDAAAVEWHRRALALDPDLVNAFMGLGVALFVAGQAQEAGAAFRAALAREPGSFRARWCECMTRLPPAYTDSAEIERCRDHYRTGLIELRQAWEAQEDGSFAAAISLLQPFYLPAQGRDDRALQALYGTLVTDIMAERYPGWSRRLERRHRSGEAIRVGIVSGFFRDHSNWKIPIRGWVEHLDRRRFRLFGYHTQARQDEQTALARGSFDRFARGPLTLPQWAETIAGDALDVLIYPEIGMDPATLPLAALRLAPVQCTSWGHPTTSGLPTMDYFLSSDLMEPEDGATHYTETLIRLPKLSIFYTPDHAAPGSGGEDRAAALRAGLQLPADAVVYWCGQSLHKYLPEHDTVFPRIAARIPGARFLFIDAKPALTGIFRRRLEAAFAARNLEFAHHCRFLPALPPAEFAASLRCSDIFLDSISWSGCNTTLEAVAFDLPIVTCAGALMRGRHSAAILAVTGMTETVAGSVEEYVDLAIRLAEDPTWRREISTRLAAGKRQIYGELAPVRALEALLEEWAVAKS